MEIIKASYNKGITTVRYRSQDGELEIKTEDRPRPEFVAAFKRLTYVVCYIVKAEPQLDKDGNPTIERNFRFSPYELTRTITEDTETVKITSFVLGIDGYGKLVTPAIDLSFLSSENRACIDALIAEAERFAKGERAQLEFEAVAGKEAA